MRRLLPYLLPCLALAAYLLLEKLLHPFVWVSFFPAMFLSAWLDGKRGALITGLISGIFTWTVIEPRLGAAGNSVGLALAYITFVGFGGAVGAMRDRTRRDELRARTIDRDFSLMFDTMSEGLALNECVYDDAGAMIDYRILRVNKAYFDSADFSGGNPVGRLASEVYGMGETAIRQFWQEHKDRKEARQVEYLSPLRGKWFVIFTSPFVGNHFVTSFFEITSRKSMEEMLRRRESELARVQEIARLGSYSWDVQTGTLQWSEVNKEIWGFDRVPTFEECAERIHPEDRERVFEAGNRTREEGAPFNLKYRIVLPDGSVRHLHDQALAQTVDGKTVAMLGTVLDVTEIHRALESLREMEAALEKSARIASLATLARGIAHDFNNFLSGVFGHMEVALAVNKDPQVAELLARATSSIERARNLTGQLLTFAKGDLDLQARHPGPLIEETVRFALTGSGMGLDIDIAPDLWPAAIDAGQIARVFENLAMNAKQACGGQGNLRIRAFNGGAAYPYPSDLAAGEYIVVTVADDGPGIPEEALAHIFEPFYTTRSGGTGLGLATSHSIMKRHQGTISVRSQNGAEFHLFLPRSTTAAQEKPEPLPADGPIRPRRILVMDDQEDIRSLLQEALTLLGQECVAVADGAAAVREFAAGTDAGRKFDLCIFDLTVPGGTGGLEAARQVREIDQGVAVIIASGYPGDLTDREYRLAGISAIVQKPFTLAQLRGILSRSE